MTKTTSNGFRQGQTRFSASAEMVTRDSIPRVVAAKSTMPNIANADVYMRAQYIGPSSGNEGHVIVSVNPQKTIQKAAIRDMNDELQGRSSGMSTTSLDFVMGR